ncbi:MAG: arsenate reductase ArsC [Planctomycetes bacterium]|nr:arsenate reductase ArsC [Planctomycetota bacterium]
MAERKQVVLVLCTGNSCRSQFAEEFLRKHGGDRLDVYSAGTEPAERVNPYTVRTLKEVGIDIAQKKPIPIEKYLGHLPVYTLMIVCDGAAKTCPTVWPGVMERSVMPFEDPAAFTGPEDEKLAKFREVRDLIEREMKAWVEGIDERLRKRSALASRS